MLYVYKQFPRPTNISGVAITIEVLDSNGNFRTVGNTTSDANGFYQLNWKPDIQGTYTVFASFAGSAAYYPSHATTAFAVEPEATHESTQPPAESIADMYFIPAVAGIIVAIAIVGTILAILLLRKRT